MFVASEKLQQGVVHGEHPSKLAGWLAGWWVGGWLVLVKVPGALPKESKGSRSRSKDLFGRSVIWLARLPDGFEANERQSRHAGLL